MSDSSPEALRADIERQREQLATTVDELHQRIDPRTNTQPYLVAGAVCLVALVAVVVWRRRG